MDLLAFSPEKLLILALVLVLVFGSKRLPGIARQAGKGLRETRSALGIEAVRDELGELRSTVTGSSTDGKPSETAGDAKSSGAAPVAKRSATAGVAKPSATAGVAKPSATAGVALPSEAAALAAPPNDPAPPQARSGSPGSA